MQTTKPITNLRNKTREIATFCHDQDEPVYLTTNGVNDLVIMSVEHYERLKTQVDLFDKLSVAQKQSTSGKRGITHKQMISKLLKRANAE